MFNFKDLKPGDTVFVDTRRLFMDDHQWTEATFVRWDNIYTQFPRDQYVPGVRNRMVISVMLKNPTPSRPGRWHPPLLTHLGGLEFEVSSQDVRTGITPP